MSECVWPRLELISLYEYGMRGETRKFGFIRLHAYSKAGLFNNYATLKKYPIGVK